MLEYKGHRAVVYLEQDRDTFFHDRVAARKSPGYRELYRQRAHRQHFPETTLDAFFILFVTPTNKRATQLKTALPGRTVMTKCSRRTASDRLKNSLTTTCFLSRCINVATVKTEPHSSRGSISVCHTPKRLVNSIKGRVGICLVWISIFLPHLLMAPSNKETNNKPVLKFQLRGLTASVFENHSENGSSFYKVSITRTYKDGDTFKSTSAFGRDDLPLVAELSRQSWLSIMDREATESKSKRDS